MDFQENEKRFFCFSTFPMRQIFRIYNSKATAEGNITRAFHLISKQMVRHCKNVFTKFYINQKSTKYQSVREEIELIGGFFIQENLHLTYFC